MILEDLFLAFPEGASVAAIGHLQQDPRVVTVLAATHLSGVPDTVRR